VPIRTGRGGCCPASVSRDPSENARSFAYTLSTPLAALWLLKIRNSKFGVKISCSLKNFSLIRLQTFPVPLPNRNSQREHVD